MHPTYIKLHGRPYWMQPDNELMMILWAEVESARDPGALVPSDEFTLTIRCRMRVSYAWISTTLRNLSCLVLKYDRCMHLIHTLVSLSCPTHWDVGKADEDLPFWPAESATATIDSWTLGTVRFFIFPQVFHLSCLLYPVPTEQDIHKPLA